MEFTCAYCEKQILGVSIVIDKTHIIHSSCQDGYNKNKLVSKWEEAGHLDGIKGLVSDDKSKLYECCK